MYSPFLIYTPLHSCPPLFKAVLQLINPKVIQYLCRFCIHLITWWKMGFLQYTFHFGVQNKATGCQIREYGGCSSIGMRLSGRNFLTERALWAGAFSWCSTQMLFFQRFGRFFHKGCRTVSLLIPTMSAIILTLSRLSLRTISLIFWMF